MEPNGEEAADELARAELYERDYDEPLDEEDEGPVAPKGHPMTLVKYWILKEFFGYEIRFSSFGETVGIYLAHDVEKVVAEKDEQWTKTNAEYERVSRALSMCQAELARVKGELEQTKRLVEPHMES